MALNTPQLAQAIVDAMKLQLPSPDSNQQSEMNAFANAMASAIETYVKSAQVMYTAGLVAPSGGGPVTGVLTHTIQ